MNDKKPDADRVIAGWQETIREVEANKDGFVEISRKQIATTPTQAMDDKTLVERLRDRGVCSIAQNSCRNDYICEEAATRIEALEAALRDYMSAFGQALEANGIPFSKQQREADEAARQALESQP